MTNQSFEDAPSHDFSKNLARNNKFRLLLLIVEEIGRAGKYSQGHSTNRNRARSRRFGAPSRATRVIKLVWLAGAPYSADCGHTLLQGFETAVGCAAPTAAIRCTPWIWVVGRRLCG